jgi:hypothetical protein
VKLVYTIVAVCDPEPDSSSFDPRDDTELLDEFEDAVASKLATAGAGFTIDSTATVEYP